MEKCHFLSDEQHLSIKKIKDLYAAAVLIMAVVAVVVGLMVLLPYVYQLFALG